jgi:hypothetical protein
MEYWNTGIMGFDKKLDIIFSVSENPVFHQSAIPSFHE